MGIILYALANFIISIIDCLGYILIGYILLGWIVLFGVIKSRDSVFLKIYVFLMTRIEPILGIVRRFIPSVFGLDFSAMVVFFALYIAKVIIIQIAISLG